MKADPYKPTFGFPISDWYHWFAWHPVRTADRGWRWLTIVNRRHIQKKFQLDGGPDTWFQHCVKK